MTTNFMYNTTAIRSLSSIENATFTLDADHDLYFQSRYLPKWISAIFWFVRNVEGFLAISLNLLTIIAVYR